jgi:hypothetical protein
MSAYGAMAAPKPLEALEPLYYPLKSGGLSLHPVSAVEAPDELVAYLHGVFARELEGESVLILIFALSALVPGVLP